MRIVAKKSSSMVASAAYRITTDQPEIFPSMQSGQETTPQPSHKDQELNPGDQLREREWNPTVTEDAETASHVGTLTLTPATTTRSTTPKSTGNES